MISLLLALASLFATSTSESSATTFLDLGKNYEVRILRDNFGVPHIFGKADTDTSFGLAYAHSEDDFPTIAEAILQARGEMASYKGKDHAPIDYVAKLLKVKQTVAEGYSTMSQESRAVCDAYADGLNFYVAKHPAALPSRYLPITGVDVVAAAVFKGPFFYGLDQELRKIVSGKRARSVSKKSANASTNAKSSLNAGAAIQRWLQTEEIEIGSNAFAVAPSRTADASTFLAINPHLPWTGPATFYEAHLVSEEGWNCIGGTFPGSPTILLGHNQHLGWAHTINGPDLIDVYVLDINPANKNQYKFDGKWLDFERWQIPIEVQIFGDVTFTIHREALWSVHGPVMRQEHGVYAICYSSIGDVRQVEQWYDMNKATNFKEWQDAMRIRASASMNSVYADKEGNIYYLYNGKLPVRTEGYNWHQYLPGDTSETLWKGFITFDQMPQVLNPPSGFVMNCNNTPFRTTTGEGNPNQADFSSTLGIENYMNNRSLRAMELLGGNKSITWDEFCEYKYDDTYSEASDEVRTWKHICQAKSDDPATQAALEIWRKWNRRTNKANTSAALVILTLSPDSNTDWRSLDEADTKKLLKEITWVAELLKKTHGKIDPAWGDVNRIIRGDANFAIDGAPDVLRAVYQRISRRDHLDSLGSGQVAGIAGDCYTLLVRWDAEGNVSSEAIHQYGSAPARPNSPHYNDQLKLFTNKKTRKSLLTEAEIRKHLSREYVPGEESPQPN